MTVGVSLSIKSKVWFPALLLVLAGLMNPLPMTAQTVYGSIYGTAFDASGAALANATVTVTNQQKGITDKTQSNAAGDYRIDHLIPNVYTVSVSAAGFKTFTLTGVQVNAGDSPRVDATLSIGSASESVTVAASAEALLQTESQQVAVTIQQNVIQDLPVPAQGMNNIVFLSPGAQSLFGISKVTGEYPSGGALFSIDGQTTGNLNFTLDGIDNTSPILDIIVVNPPPDTVSAAKIVTHNMDADVGKAMSASVPMETKSGSNSFHGEVNDFRTSAANLARNPFNASQSKGSNPGTVAPALKNAYEVNIGGPIIKNRLFFFFDYYAQRVKVGGSATTTVMSSHARNTCLGLEPTSTGALGCDFGEYLTAFGGNGTVWDNVTTPGTPTKYANNIIPASRISPQAINILKLLPAPNTTGTSSGLANNYAANGTGVTNSGQYTERVDYQATDKIHIFGRYSYFHDELNGNPIFGPVIGGAGPSGLGNPAKAHNHNIALGLDDALTNNLLTDVRLGYYRLHEDNAKYNKGVNLASNLGIPGLNGTGYALTDGAPNFTVGTVPGAANLAFGNNCNCQLFEDEEQFQIVNNWTRIVKSHSIKWGADLRYGRNLRVPSDTNRSGSLTFATGPTSNGSGSGGLGFATFMMGNVTQFGRYVSKTSNAKEFQKRTFFYGIDSWRVTSKLTVNYGLRWEIYFPETINAPGNGSQLNLNTGLMQVAGVGPFSSNMGYKTVLTNFAPRVGLSYQLDRATVVRAGLGRAFGMGVYGTIFGHSSTQNIPALANQQINPSGNTASVFNLAQGPPGFVFPTVDAQTGTVPLPDRVTASSRPNPMRYQTLDSWNVSVQRALTGTLTLTAAYVGNKGTHVFAGNFQYINPNPPYSILAAANSVTGTPLHWDATATTAAIAAAQSAFGPQYPDIDKTGATANIFRLLPLNTKFGWTQPINYYCNCSDTHYNALQLTVDKRFSHGLNITGNYAWQYANNYDSPYFWANKKIEYGPQDYTRHHVLTAFGFYRLPFGRQGDYFKDTPRWADAIIGGWQLTPNINISSGLPFNVTYSGCSANLPPASAQQAGASGAPCWPDKTGSFSMGPGTYDSASHTRRYFTPVTTSAGTAMSRANPAAGPFSFPALDQIGNIGRNPYRGPTFWNADIAIQKNVTFWENVQGQFRMDAFNAFNHMAPANPSGLVIDGGSSNGLITGLAIGENPRQLVFAAKILF